MPLRVRLINYLLKGTNLMATLQEAIAKVATLTSTIGLIDAKLDEIRAFIAGLGLPQADLDQLNAMLDTANASAEAALAETDALDEAT